MKKSLLIVFAICVSVTPAAAQEENRQQKYRDEIAALSSKLEIQPWNYAALFNRGLAHENVGEYDRAIADYTRALDPQADTSNVGHSKEECRAHAYHYRGRAYDWYKKDFAKAVADYTEALRLDPSTENVHYRRGRALRAQQKFADAQRDFAEALQRDADDSNLLTSWAWQLATCPDAKYRDGARALEFAIKANEKSKLTIAQRVDVLAACYAENGKFDEAIATQEKAIGLLKAKDAILKTRMEERLSLYQAKRPFREE